MARAVLLLASDASFVTGVELTADAGFAHVWQQAVLVAPDDVRYDAGLAQ